MVTRKKLQETLEDFWDDINKKIYYIFAIALIISVPFIVGAPGFQSLPVLSDIYALGKNIGLFDSNTFVLKILSICAIWAIFAASWDLLSGYTGQVSFGHAIFWGLGAYFSFWVTEGFLVSQGFGPFDPITALLLSGFIASILAFLLGIIALRVKGSYLALITLIIPLVAANVVVLFPDLGGYWALKITDQAQLVPSVGDREIDALNFFLFLIVFLGISWATMNALAHSRFGLAFQSIREDEDAAESLGINLRFYKIFAFTVSAFFAAIAGVLYSNWVGSVDKSVFNPSFSFTIIILCVFGGIGSISGGVAGAFIITLLIELFLNPIFSGVHGVPILAYGLLLVLTLRYMRFGLFRATREQKKACVVGVLFALSWTILTSISLSTLNLDLWTLLGLLVMFVFTLPTIPVFVISEYLGIFVFTNVLGMSLSPSILVKATFIIQASVGIPFAFYLPKIFKRLRLHYWGVWPSAGRYEPD